MLSAAPPDSQVSVASLAAPYLHSLRSCRSTRISFGPSHGKPQMSRQPGEQGDCSRGQGQGSSKIRTVSTEGEPFWCGRCDGWQRDTPAATRAQVAAGESSGRASCVRSSTGLGLLLKLFIKILAAIPLFLIGQDRLRRCLRHPEPSQALPALPSSLRPIPGLLPWPPPQPSQQPLRQSPRRPPSGPLPPCSPPRGRRAPPSQLQPRQPQRARNLPERGLRRR